MIVSGNNNDSDRIISFFSACHPPYLWTSSRSNHSLTPYCHKQTLHAYSTPRQPSTTDSFPTQDRPPSAHAHSLVDHPWTPLLPALARSLLWLVLARRWRDRGCGREGWRGRAGRQSCRTRWDHAHWIDRQRRYRVLPGDEWANNNEMILWWLLWYWLWLLWLWLWWLL